MNASLHKDCSGDNAFENEESSERCCLNSEDQSRKQRPVSVIGGVDLFSSDAEEKDDCLPSVSHNKLHFIPTRSMPFLKEV